MPEYKHILSDTQMWQVSLLLANANKPLPPAALEILRGKAAAAPAAPVAPAAPAPAAPAPATKKQKGEGSTA
jgi:hypothetical protein